MVIYILFQLQHGDASSRAVGVVAALSTSGVHSSDFGVPL